jgi:hypothetical protein
MHELIQAKQSNAQSISSPVQTKETENKIIETINEIPSKEDHSKEIITGLKAAGKGELLSKEQRKGMESHFAYDFSRIRIHPNSGIAADMGARAIASSEQIWFSSEANLKDPKLFTHEMTHIVQQAMGKTTGLTGADSDRDQKAQLELQADSESENSSFTNNRAIKPLPSSLLQPAVLQFSFDEDVLKELHGLPDAEEEGLNKVERNRREGLISARKTRLKILFSTLMGGEAKRIYERLKVRVKGDVLSKRFHDMLSGPLRKQLLDILLAQVSGKPGVAEGPDVKDILRVDQRVSIKGLPVDQPNFADIAFNYLTSAPVGDEYNLFPRPGIGSAKNGISIPKSEFYLDKDPLGAFVIIHPYVYPSRKVAEAVIADLDKASPGMLSVTYYLRDGIIFPTTLSMTTLPNLIPQIQGKRDSDKRDLAANAALAKNVLLWYIGARFPIRVGSGTAPAAAKVPAATGGTGAAVATTVFNAARVADDLVVTTAGLANAGQKMLAAARQLSIMRNLTALEKVGVMQEFFKRIGFAISKAGVVDEAGRLLMYSEDSRYVFSFLKSTGEIIYGRFDLKTAQYIWELLK